MVYFAEFLGTFLLVFVGTGAIVLSSFKELPLANITISLAFGLAVTIVILLFGKISGAHINPAVTLSFWIKKHLYSKKALFYIASQLAGAFTASLLLKYFFPLSKTLGETLPKIKISSAFFIEVIITFFLVLIILVVSSSKMPIVAISFIVGGDIMLSSILAGPLTGASMNPARSFGPALLSGNLSSLWLYITAPLIGAIFASITFGFVKKRFIL